MKTTFLVIVHPPAPVKETGTNYTVTQGPQIRRVTAENARRAVEMVTILPGGHALVVPMDSVVRFDRAKQAPLEQREPDGNPLPEAVAA